MWPIHASYCLVGAGDLDAAFVVLQETIARGELVQYTAFKEIEADPRWQVLWKST